MLTSLWAAAIPPVSSGAAVAYQTLFTTLRRLVVGRTLSARFDDGELTLTVTEFDSRLDVRALAVGQFNDVRIVATDLQWDGTRLDRATVMSRNVHMRPGVPPTIVAAPIDLTVELPATILDSWVRAAMPRLSGEIGADGIPRLRWARRPTLGSLDVEAQLDGPILWLTPRALTLRRRRWSLPARMPAYPVNVPHLPRGLHLTGISFGPGAAKVTGTLPEWQMGMPRAGLEDIIDQLGSVRRTLNLTRWSRPW
jgi:hypothetical protein